jgi:Phytanoyl-CoA dioxygenase (PhyH)
MGKTSLEEDFFQNGYAVVQGVIDVLDCEHIIRSLEVVSDKAGSRLLLDADWCARMPEQLASDSRLSCSLPPGHRPVQCTPFIKTINSNWLVALHQDLSIPVAERVVSPLCSGWSMKEAETFVQPPVSVLEQMVAIRVHLDDCDETNGALRIVQGSHRQGRIDAAQAIREREERGESVVCVPKGGVMIMRPLLLHASSKSRVDVPRRVLHFVYGPPSLPEGLRWPARERSLAGVG